LIITGIEGGECGYGLGKVCINNVGDLRSKHAHGLKTCEIERIGEHHKVRTPGAIWVQLMYI